MFCDRIVVTLTGSELWIRKLGLLKSESVMFWNISSIAEARGLPNAGEWKSDAGHGTFVLECLSLKKLVD